MNIIFGNYGNHSIALIQWAFEHEIPIDWVVAVNTGWTAEHWSSRVKLAETYAQSKGFKTIILNASPNLAEQVLDRGAFPTQKFQWCASFLKGLPFLDWLDQVDSSCEANILLPKIRTPRQANLAEFIDSSDHYNGRQVWHPLFQYQQSDLLPLLQRSGLSILSHRSLECEPCIHASSKDLQRLTAPDILKVEQIEQTIGKCLFEHDIRQMVTKAKQQKRDRGELNDNGHNGLELGCGLPYSCGE